MTRIDAPTQYFFSAIATDGARKRGLRPARDKASLANTLSEDGLLLLSARRLPAWTSRTTDLPLRDQAMFNQQVGGLLARGVPLVEALEVASSVVSKRTKRQVERIRALVGAGSSFADACEQAGGFDPVTITVYRASERAGDLGDAAIRLAKSANRKQAIASKAITLMIYPAIVSGVSALVATVVLTIVVPRIGNSLLEQDITLPWYTHAVINFGEGLRSYGLLVLLALIVIGAALVLGRRLVFAAAVQASRLAPPIARLLLAMESARFFSVMAAMSSSGVPLADALAVSSSTVSHPELRDQLEQLRVQLVEGGVLRNLLERVDALPLATRRLLIAAERAGDLDAAFDGLAEDLTEEVDTRSERLLAMLEPALIIIMFLVIGSLLMSLMVPILTITTNLEGV